MMIPHIAIIIKTGLKQILLLSRLQLLNVDLLDDRGQSFTDQEIKDESLTFLLAGHETTGNLMVWILSVLMTDESVLQACREEVDRFLPNNTEPNNENLTEIVVCEAVINEALHLYPPAVLFLRTCICDHLHFVSIFLLRFYRFNGT